MFLKSLQVIIVEDETGAASNLRFLLKEVAPQLEVMAVLPSIEETQLWLAEHKHPDLAFFDIQLEDGLSFEIFREIEINFPVIFTTAFDQYAINAFKVNSIDYLLKPVKEQDILASLKKYENLNRRNVDVNLIESILTSMSTTQGTSSFLVHYKGKLVPLSAADVAYFYIENGLVHGCTVKNQVLPIEHTLEELEESLSRQQFFRANRQFIINRHAIKDVDFYFNGRLSINMQPATRDLVLISKARVSIFKAWMKG